MEKEKKLYIIPELNDIQKGKIRKNNILGGIPELLSGRQIELSEKEVEALRRAGVEPQELEGKDNDKINEDPSEKVDAGPEKEKDKEKEHEKGEPQHNKKEESREEKKSEQKEEKKDLPLNEEQQKVVAERIKIVSSIILNAPSSTYSAKDKALLLSAYCSNPNRLYWDFDEDPDFLKGTVANDIGGNDDARKQIHRSIRSAADSNRDIGESEVNTKSYSMRISKEMGDEQLSESDKAKVRSSMADWVSKAIKSIVSSGMTPDRILIEVRDIKGRLENEKESIANSFPGIDKDDSALDYINQMGNDETRDIMQEAKKDIGNIQISLQGIDLTNPSEANTAIKLLNDATRDVPGDAIVSVSVEVNMDEKSDISQTAQSIQELEASGFDVECEEASVDEKEVEEVNEDVPEAEKGSKLADAALVGGILAGVAGVAYEAYSADREDALGEEEIELEPELLL